MVRWMEREREDNSAGAVEDGSAGAVGNDSAGAVEGELGVDM